MRLAWCAVICACILAAQSVTTAIVSGRVEDSSGGAIRGSSVSALDIDRNQQRSVSVDAAGRFRLPALPPGTYRITASANGFQTLSRNISVTVGQNLDLPFSLQPASANASVQVIAESQGVETVRTQIADTISRAEVDNLPLNGRNFLDLAFLSPLASRTNTGDASQFTETSAIPQTGISVAGQRNLNAGYIVDGLSANDDAADLAGTFYSEDVVREFQVIESGGIAEFGRASSGTINVVTRSGTDSVHGRLYGFARNQRLDARNPLLPVKEPLTQTQYGATLGGPLRRDRTFYFTNFEQTRKNATGVITITPAALNAINPILARIGYKAGPISTGAFPTGYDATNLFARVDHRIGESQSISARYSLYKVDAPNSRNDGGLGSLSTGASVHDTDSVVALNHTWTSENRVNEARYEYTRSKLGAPVNDAFGPTITIAGAANIGQFTSSPIERDLTFNEIADSYSLVKGAHTVKFGEDFIWNRVNIVFPGAVNGSYSFSSLTNFQSGTYTSFTQAFGATSQFQSNPGVGIFVQDEWRVSRAFTLNAGLRYDEERLPNPVQTDWHDVAPRVGLAWSPNRKWVARASAGLFYDRMPLRATSNALQRDGTKYKSAVINFGQPGAPVFPNLIGAFPAGILPSVSWIDPNIRNSYSAQASAQIERELTATSTLAIGFEHLRGIHLIMSRNINVPTLTAAQAATSGIANLGRPNVSYGNISQYEGTGDSYFNGAFVTFNRRAGKYLSGRVSYTFSKAIDDDGNAFFAQPQNAANLRDDRGLSLNDQRHRVVVSGLVNSPWKNAAARAWQFSLIATANSAEPFNILAGTDRLNQGSSSNARPFGVARNTGTGWGNVSVDAHIKRQFVISERWNLEALAEGFNLTNRANYEFPNGTYGTGSTPIATFRQPTAVGPARQLQLGLRLNW